MKTLLFLCLAAATLNLMGADSKNKSTCLWDVTFNRDEPGKPPKQSTKEEVEELKTGKLPLKSYTNLDFVTKTRTAIVQKEAFGLNDQPVVFSMPDNHQPTWGPRMSFSIPHDIALKAKQLRLSLDVAKNNVSKCGGFELWDLLSVRFCEDGTIKANDSEIARYQASKPIHFDFLIDNEKKTTQITINGDKSKATTLSWRRVKAENFRNLRLDGLLPGGYAMAPGKIAFDNIELSVIK